MAIKSIITVIATLSSIGLKFAHANYSNDDDLLDLKGLSGKLTQVITLTSKEESGIMGHYKNVIFFVKGNVEDSEPFLKTYCKIRSSDEDSPATRIEPSGFTITRVKTQGCRLINGAHSEDIVLSTNSGFDIVCHAGPGVWKNFEQRMKAFSNGMQLKNLRNAFGKHIEF